MAKKRRAKKMSRPEPVQNLVHTGSLGTLAANSVMTRYFNCAHLLSMMNRKAYHQVTKSGHLKNYGVELQVFNMTNATTTIRTAPVAYPTYRAVRAWHFIRKDRYEKAGFKLKDLGYGERLRFALDQTMGGIDQTTSSTMISPSNYNDSEYWKGEWDWSDVIITPGLTTGSATTDIHADDLQDKFDLYLCGDHQAETGEADKYHGVGMIQSWTENRRGWNAPQSESTIQPDNPLAFARMSESSSYLLNEEVRDEQGQAPPYSNKDDDDAESPFATLFINGVIESSFPNPTTNNDVVLCPGGVGRIDISNNTDAASYPWLSMRIYEM